MTKTLKTGTCNKGSIPPKAVFPSWPQLLSALLGELFLPFPLKGLVLDANSSSLRG